MPRIGDNALAKLAPLIEAMTTRRPALELSPEPEAFLRTVSLGTHLDRLPEDLRDPFVRDVAERIGSPLELGYVRLNISARRPAA